MSNVADYRTRLRDMKDDIHNAEQQERHGEVGRLIQAMATEIHPLPALVAATRWMEGSQSPAVRTGALQVRDDILGQIQKEHPLCALISAKLMLEGQNSLDYSNHETSFPQSIVNSSCRVDQNSSLGIRRATSFMVKTYGLITQEVKSTVSGLTMLYEAELEKWKKYVESFPSLPSDQQPVSRTDVVMATMAVCEFNNYIDKTYENTIAIQSAERSVDQFFASFPKNKGTTSLPGTAPGL